MMMVGCTPLLTPELQREMSHVYVAFIPERSGQQLRRLLEQSFQGKERKYIFKVRLLEGAQSLFLSSDAKTRLSHVTLHGEYQLMRSRDRKVLDQGQVTAYSTKTLIPSYYSCTTADGFILENNLHQLSRLLLHRVAKAINEEMKKTVDQTVMPQLTREGKCEGS